MISREEILKGQVCPPELEENLQGLLDALNKFRTAYGKPMIVSSGLRSSEHNQMIGGRSASAHLSAQAADFRDADGSLAAYCLSHLSFLEECGLYLEDPSYTKVWVHLQSRVVPSGHRVFIP